MGRRRLPCPSKEEQNEIARNLAACDKRVGSAEQKYESLQDIFNTLLHELMTAKTRVNGLTSLSSAQNA